MIEKFLRDVEEMIPFEAIEDQYTSGDEVALEELINDISHYDIYDFIARVSSLNLLIENQNKSIVFDALIAGILLKERASYVGTAKMSNSKFRKIIGKLQDLSLYHMVDPAENLFIERVRYYGNYWIFPGTNFSPSFCIQGFIDCLCLRGMTCDPEFLKRAHQIINFVLQISNSIIESLNYDINSIKHIETRAIIVPNSLKCEDLKKNVIIDKKLIESLLPSQDLQIKLFSSFEEGAILSVLKENRQTFFAHPFIQAHDNSIILLNPSILVPFAIHQILVLAEEYGLKEQLISNYNDVMWEQSRRDIRELGHKKIDEKAYGIELLNSPSFKEEILTVGNDGLLFLFFICDKGTDYNEKSMFTDIDITEEMPCLKKRTSHFLDCLPNASPENSSSVVIVNGFGRMVLGAVNKENIRYAMVLSPLELHCISVNEHNHPNFISQYLRAKSRITIPCPPILSSELNNIEIYTQRECSFYISDDFDPKNTILHVGLGESLDYVIRAFYTEDRQLISNYDNIHLSDVVLNDPVRNIYFAKRREAPPELVIKFEQVAIWVTAKTPLSVDEAHIYYTLIDFISYWLAEARDIINEMQFERESICIKIQLSESCEEYFKPKDNKPDILSGIKQELEVNAISMIWDSCSYRCLGEKSNQIEKQVISSLLDVIQRMSTTAANTSHLDKIFENPLKKKVFEVDTLKSPYAIPTAGDMQIISSEDVNLLLDEIGTHFLQETEYEYGRVPDEKRAKLANDVVSYLYSLLQKEVSSINFVGVYERICFDLETVMYRVMTSQKRYAYDVSCYPEKIDSITNQYNEANKSSVALKFFAEYVAAIPPNGKKTLGEIQYGRILAICHLIIEWAYRNDMFVYNIVNAPIEFLPSGRIGMARGDDEYLNSINASSRVRRLMSLSNPSISVFSRSKMISEYEKELDEVFLDEYGFDFHAFIKVILAICTYGDTIGGEVKRTERKKLIVAVSMETKIEETTISEIIDQITLTERADFLIPPKPFEKYDVYPWRFNRELSYTRRPIIQYKNELIWGNRQLHHMWRYVVDLIFEGKYKVRSQSFKKLIGKISNKRGEEFNFAVYEKLNSIPNLIVYKMVSKINGKKITSRDGNDLGDIDVLCIIPRRKKIIVGEVKDFSIAKNPYEMDQEYKKIFVDGKKPCFVTRHKRRVAWVQEHLEDVIKQYGLQSGRWTVHSVMFVNEEIISNLYYHKHETIITYSDIDTRRVFSV